MYFDQKIKYLDYLEGGARVRGAGFLRLECWGKTCNLVLQASGLFEQAQGSYPVYLQGEGREEHLGDLFLQNGKGRLELRNLSCESMGAAQGMSAAEIEEIRIPLGESRQLIGILRERKAPENERESTRESAWERTREAVGDTAKAGKMQAEVREEITQAEIREETVRNKNGKDVAQAEKGMDVSRAEKREEIAQAEKGNDVARAKTGMETAPAEISGAMIRETQATETVVNRDEVNDPEISFARQANLKPGKWEQLLAIYPPITPFGDARRYLQISPGDFVILKDRSYRMVNNSFLLHGYFTYRHLILHRQNRRGEMAYYVGVPGRYYDREKEVAILFGFESFEGAEEPAKEGDFGYYMMRVEL